jgi:hypothetical protein
LPGYCRNGELRRLIRRRRDPVVFADKLGQQLLPLEGELCLGKPRHSGRLLQEEVIHALCDVRHPFIEI